MIVSLSVVKLYVLLFASFLKTETTDSLKMKKKFDLGNSYNNSLQSTWMRLEKYVYDT